MAELEDYFTGVQGSLSQVLVGALPDGVTITIELSGEGGGTWTIARTGPDALVRAGNTAYPDCRLRSSVDDFRALLDGELKSREGFLAGRLRVEGDVGLILRLEQWVVRRPGRVG